MWDNKMKNDKYLELETKNNNRQTKQTSSQHIGCRYDIFINLQINVVLNVNEVGSNAPPHFSSDWHNPKYFAV